MDSERGSWSCDTPDGKDMEERRNSKFSFPTIMKNCLIHLANAKGEYFQNLAKFKNWRVRLTTGRASAPV
ncbi:hypothetical protein AV530_005547 [Patagioenas fasciata monilis]|uniref:Uncharacterized protein n=1 Tax=Patagioenas fasciata monilis TaxID=372326 RepID=A0A1V4JLS8_PATFA|nr:hypothetical protein AV530_005547 [Patagioenas fasciata monilis]